MLLLSFFFSLQKYEYFQVHANNWDKQYENVMNVTNKRAKNKFFIYACRYPLKRNLDNHRLSAIGKHIICGEHENGGACLEPRPTGMTLSKGTFCCVEVIPTRLMVLPLPPTFRNNGEKHSIS